MGISTLVAIHPVLCTVPPTTLNVMVPTWSLMLGLVIIFYCLSDSMNMWGVLMRQHHLG